MSILKIYDGSSWQTINGITDHGALSGLSDDDHPQYTLSATNLGLSSSVTDHSASASVHQPAHYCFAYTSTVQLPVGTGWEQVSGFGTILTEGYDSPGWSMTDGNILRMPGAGTYEINAKVIVDKSDSGLGHVQIRLTEYVVSHALIGNSEARGAVRGNNVGGATTFIIHQTADATPDIGVQIKTSGTSITSPVRGIAVMVKKISDETA